MLIAQITDLHLGFEPGNPDELNRRRLDRTLAALLRLSARPDLLLVTGDLADKGDDASYARLREATASLPFPACFALGNHDSRDGFRRSFPATPMSAGFVQYAIDDWTLRILVLDTLEEGRHGGAFCERRASWLRERLDEQPQRPTLIALHHPPIDAGLSWIGENPQAPWIRRLEGVIAGRTNVVGLVAGHLHRPVATRFAGTVLTVCPATAPQLALDLAEMDVEAPDGREMVLEAPPAFALHLWQDGRLVTHFGTADEHPVLARFDERMHGLVRHLHDERTGG